MSKDEELIDQVVRSCVMSQYIYSKIQFDNAKDTTALLAAAEESSRLLIDAVKYKMVRYKEELTIHTLEELLKGDNGELAMRDADDKWIKVKVILTQEETTHGN